VESLLVRAQNSSSDSDTPLLPQLSFGHNLSKIFDPEPERDLTMQNELDERWGIMSELETAFDVSFSLSDSLDFRL
jgi:hypothetical protein